MGHSAGGVFTQILLDHGFGAAGVAINSAPTEGVKVVPLSQIKATFPVLKNPANRHKAVGFTPEQWHYAFTNTFSEEESLRALRALPHPRVGPDLLGQRARQHPPRPQDDPWVDYHNDDRAPLLFISGSEDHLMPPSIQKSNAKHYKARTRVTEVKEYEGYAHLLPAQDGWEEIADDALSWAVEHATGAGDALERSMDGVRITHIGGPTVLIEVGGLADPHRPDVRPAGPHVRVRVGNVVAQARPGPRDRRSPTSARSTRCCSPTTTTPTTSTTPAGPCCPSAGVVVTTVAGARAPRWDSAGSRPVGHARCSRRPGRPTIEVTATPCRHGPPLSRPIVGDVVGFALRWDGPGARRALDLGRHRALRRRARRWPTDSTSTRRSLHLGGVRFPITGPIRYR